MGKGGSLAGLVGSPPGAERDGSLPRWEDGARRGRTFAEVPSGHPCLPPLRPCCVLEMPSRPPVPGASEERVLALGRTGH